MSVNAVLTGKKSTRIRDTSRDKVFYVITALAVGFFMLIVLLPLINIVASSFSSPAAVSAGRVLLWPVDFSLEGYVAVFETRMIGQAYLNTFFYTVAGTFINIAMTMLAAYPLARGGLPLRGGIMFLFTFTMMFSGGTIPNYMLMMNLKLINSRWVMLLPGAISVYNMIIARTFIQNIPNDFYEAASIDGCSDAKYFLSIVLPLSSTMLSVLTLYYAVGHWNSYFNAFLYLNDRELLPLQIILRGLLTATSIVSSEVLDDETMLAKQGLSDLLKYALIIVSSLPVLVLYPFIKRYFAKGVMLGGVKG